MASKLVKVVNSGYRHRYTRKRAKGIGVYATQQPGVGPNGIHVVYRKGDDSCRCGGCTTKLALATG